MLAKKCCLSLSEYLRQRALGYEPGGHPPKEVFDVLGKIDEMAESCGLASAQYAAIESGECDLSVSSLQKIARHFDVPLDVLMFGEEPKMNAYFLTRRGAGVSVERTKAYKYESLASGFRNRIAGD